MELIIFLDYHSSGSRSATPRYGVFNESAGLYKNQVPSLLTADRRMSDNQRTLSIDLKDRKSSLSMTPNLSTIKLEVARIQKLTNRYKKKQ